MTDAQMAAKIRKLLDLAEHPGTPEAERLLAAERAAALMEKHAIDELMVNGAAKAKTDQIISRRYQFKGTYYAQFSSRHNLLATAMGMKSYWTNITSGRVIVTVVGFESDFPRYEMLMASQEIQLVEAWKVWQRESKVSGDWSWMSAGEKWTAKHSYSVGYGAGFADRVKTARNHVVSESVAGTDLVLVDRSVKVNEFINENVKLRSARGTRTGADAYHGGRAAGSNARTGNGEVGGRGAISG